MSKTYDGPGNKDGLVYRVRSNGQGLVYLRVGDQEPTFKELIPPASAERLAKALIKTAATCRKFLKEEKHRWQRIRKHERGLHKRGLL